MPPKRRRRFQGLYYHSSPPKVMPMNGQAGGQNGRKRRDNEDFSVKLSTIRIWMHEKDIGKLTRILWAGQGNRLSQQASNNGRVKRFLAAVPHVMNAIKDLHQAVIDNNLENVQSHLEPPVPSALVTCKDGNGLNVIHKAAGLGHTKILEYLVGIWPEGAHETDITGKTPLHWAASAKNNMRCYTLLTQAGCDEEAVDYKMKTPSYYRHKPHEIERAFLVYVPDAPRVSPDSVTDWEALSDDTGGDSVAGGDSSSKKLDMKALPLVGNGRKSLDDSLENTSELDTNDGTSANDDDDELSKADAEPDVEPEAIASPLQRRPETPATFNTINGNGNGDHADDDSEAENIARAISADEGGGGEVTGQDGGGDASILANGNGQEEEEENEKEKEEDQPAEAEGAEDTEQPEESATESELEGNIKTEVEPEPEEEQEEKAAEQQEDEEEPEEVAIEATEDKDENENENDNDDDDEDVIASDSKEGEPQEEGAPAQSQEEDGSESLTSAMAIEGFVQGAPEDFTVQSQTAVDEDTRIKGIVESGDLEQLAEIVLNGDGGRLMGLKSPEPEIQAFLNNVPSYMEKIHRVHDAARDGGLLALQQALDRRKFAIAKDDISPNGSTALHVAVLFGHTDIVRYLASRFPETMTITDNDGRTPLHYAATIKDNGHFYHMLLQLGANPKSLDKLGHSAEFYLDRDKAKNILNYTELLNIFGAEELENQLLNDQVPDDLHSARRELQDGEISRTLERCYSVISESGKLLSGTTASALAHRKPLSASSLQLSVTSYLSRFLKRGVYEKIKRRQTRLDHNLFDVLWPAMRKTSKARHLEEDINCGIIAPDFDVFVVFQEFLVPLLKDMHCLSIDADFKPQPRLAYFPMDNGERLNTAAFVFDDESLLVTRCLVEASRNLDQLELPLNLTIGQLEQAERLMMGKIFTTCFADAIGETDSGNYYTLTELLESDSEVAMMLSSLGLMIPLLDTRDLVQAAESTAFNGALWPYGRGVFVNSANNLAVWLNCQEHLRVISTTSSKDPADMGAAYTRVGRAITYLETQLHFKESYLLGYLQSRPSYLGTGLKMTAIVKLPNLMKEMDNLRHLCSVRGLSMVTNRLSKLTVRLVNMQSMGVVEYVLFQDYCTAVTNILSLEKDMSLTNSKHIATMLVKIFRRKKNSIVDRQAQPVSFQANPIFKTEQGKYLADSLADPLIKALTEIANKRPRDPVAYLTNYLQHFMGERKPMTEVQVHSGSSKNSTSNLALAKANTTRNGPGPNNADLIELDARSLVEEEDAEGALAVQHLEERDEHGQSMLHFACARSHRRGALYTLIEESGIDITYRDELYRTARDVSLQANQPNNAAEIDRYVLAQAVIGDVEPFEQLALQGYDHILDVEDESGQSIIDVVQSRQNDALAEFLANLRGMEETREELHQMIRDNNMERVMELTAVANAKWLVKTKNYYGRTALHIAVLKESEEMVQHLVKICPETLKITDNLERTVLHYAMGTNALESVSRILIQNGAKRTSKDLKGRQPSYYFINKADILRLQEEEEESR